MSWRDLGIRCNVHCEPKQASLGKYTINVLPTNVFISVKQKGLQRYEFRTYKQYTLCFYFVH